MSRLEIGSLIPRSLRINKKEECDDEVDAFENEWAEDECDDEVDAFENEWALLQNWLFRWYSEM